MKLGLTDAAVRRVAQALPLSFESGSDANGDQMDMWIVARDSAGAGLGYVNYTYWRGEYSIKMIEVLPEYRSKGVAAALIQELLRKEEIDYSQLDWGMLTDEGAALKEHLDKTRGAAARRVSRRLRAGLLRVFRGVGARGAQDLRSSEDGVYGPGIYFYDHPYDAMSYASPGGGILYGTVSAEKAEVHPAGRSTVIVVPNPEDVIVEGVVPAENTLDTKDIDEYLGEDFYRPGLAW